MRAHSNIGVIASFSSATVAVLATLATAMVCACSGTNPNVFPEPPDSGPTTVYPDASYGTFGDGAAEAAAAICDPQPVSTFKPAWTPPEAWKQTACTMSQISGFYAACLTPPISTKTCQDYVTANPSCSSCLQSEDTASTAAAVVWHEHDAYWTVNVAGCIARATNDASSAGCGASYAAAISCRQASCNACWAGLNTTTTFDEFAACEQSAGSTTCSLFASAVPTACGNLSQGPGSVCMPSSGATAQEAFMQVAPLFCAGM
jgi:hypothetical protein